MLRGVLDAGFEAFAIARAVRAPSGEIADLLVVEVNARACAMVGRPREALINQSLLAVFPHSRTWRLWEQVCAVILTQQPLETTQHAPLPEEPDRWLQRQIVPLPDEHVAISSRDVTQRHRAQRALAASEARFRGLFENNGAAQLLVDCETSRIVDANAAAEAFYGWSRETLCAMTLADLDVQGGAEWRAVMDAVRAGRGARLSREHRVASGERRHVECSAGSVQSDGRVIMHCLVLDMTERVRAEQQVRESERRFRSLIGGMREGVVLHDASGIIRVHNPAAERILGLTGAQLTGLHPIDRDWQATHEDGSPWPTALHPAQIALQTGRSQPRQLMQVSRGGSEPSTWIVVTADPLIRPGESRPYAALAVFSDITELRHADERLREAMAFEAVAEVAGSIGHDLNNVLTVIRAATTFLRDAVSPTSPQFDDVAAIERATDRAEWLTRRLLAAGRRPAAPEVAVDLLSAARTALESLTAELPPHITLELDPSSTPLSVSVDQLRVRDVLDTMLRQARAGQSDDRGVRYVVRTALADGAENMGELSLYDTAAPIDAEMAARLAAPRFEPERRGGDRELALAVLHTLLRQTGGRLRVDVSAEGSTVRAQWPVAQENSHATSPQSTDALGVDTTISHTTLADTNVPGTNVPDTNIADVGASDAGSEAASAHASAPPRRQGGVLLVDDDARLRDLGRRMFERAGEAVYTAATGREALTFLAARADEVGLVVTDLTMPDLGGLELIDIMAAQYADIPVMAISGYGMAPGTQDRLASHHVPYVQKPFTMDVLLETASRVRMTWPSP